jgi:peptide/nickel transport system permease protein
MWQYLVKRLALLVFTLVGICVLSFFIVTQAPGDPTLSILGLDQGGKGKARSQSLDQVIEHTRRALYLDRPKIVNVSPASRSNVAQDLAEKICEGTESQRAGAIDDLKGEVGTAALAVLVAEAPARAEKAAARQKELKDLAASLDAAADKGQAAVDTLVDPLEARFSGKGPHFSKKAAPAERAKGWSTWIRQKASDDADAIAAYFDILALLVPAKDGGPTAQGTEVEKARAWTDWWKTNAARYSDESVAAAVSAYMHASDADRPARLEDVRKIGGAAVSAIMDTYFGSTGADRSRAAYALSICAHKPWDLTETADRRSAFESEWREKKSKLERDHAAQLIEEPVFEARIKSLGTADEYVASEFKVEFADQRRNIARWWFRAEESFVDFSAVRQVGRAFTQTQFGNWFRSLVFGFDFGKSYTFKKDVFELIKERFPVTAWLNFFSIFLTYVIAIPLGVYSATHPQTFSDRAMTIVLFILYSLPSFWVGSILILLFTGGLGFNWFPSHGMSSMNSENLSAFAWLKDVIWHLTLPTVCLTYGGIAAISRFMRAGMLETIRQDYIRTARAKGLSEGVVVFKHALRNSLIPILTLLAYLLPSMFGGSIIIESIFSIDGLGKLMFDAILNRDYPVIMSEVFISGFLTLLGILLADISYAIVDPRIELK